MQISAKSDYAVRALVELAADSARPLNCESIAEAQQIPFRFLKSVFRDLRSAGLVRSQRGCEGGYWLGREADSITVAEVMTAVDGAFFTVRGEEPGGPEAEASVPALWQQVEAAARALLGRTTIGELARSDGQSAGGRDGDPHAEPAAVPA
ncbi:HTH-type transcriptional regulator IscR [Streptomyces sp. YIM 130001]|uniref:RrF2 family transcriptional regulator n=1 Tax=Streptomyces sp. YIM 130001 TaxID=2259644 RepID=UPI000E65107E|nr:Rrf2 family transcriptional regulator [Streptomyces sp. YIM 130001]RII14672.1 HTH-type transcriptional regulator IscR [Streptomyces sp. YIM 130001]